MRKRIRSVLVLLALLSLPSCGGNGTDSARARPGSPTPPEAPTAGLPNADLSHPDPVSDNAPRQTPPAADTGSAEEPAKEEDKNEDKLGDFMKKNNLAAKTPVAGDLAGMDGVEHPRAQRLAVVMGDPEAHVGGQTHVRFFG